MAAKSNQQYKADQLARKKARQLSLGEKDMVLPVPVAIQAMIEDLMAREGFTDWREMLITMIRTNHKAPDLSARSCAIPKVGFTPSTQHIAQIEAYRPPAEDE